MARLAIKGHKTRGKEVIALLEMLGGINVGNFDGDLNTAYYFISDYNNDIDVDHISKVGRKQYLLFSLEEFERKFPYKVGDKVQLKKSTSCGSVFEVEKMRWIGETGNVEYTIKRLWYNNCRVTASAENLQPYKEETMEEKIQSYEVTEEICANEIAIEFNPSKFEMIERNGKYFIVKKQPQYPKTYEECCKIVDYHLEGTTIIGYEKPLLENFQKLLICRDAYWKIVGEEMGLGKPWKPDGSSGDQERYGIIKLDDNGYQYAESTSFVFPTEEMRDAFFENFKDLIKECKELL